MLNMGLDQLKSSTSNAHELENLLDQDARDFERLISSESKFFQLTELNNRLNRYEAQDQELIMGFLKNNPGIGMIIPNEISREQLAISCENSQVTGAAIGFVLGNLAGLFAGLFWVKSHTPEGLEQQLSAYKVNPQLFYSERTKICEYAQFEKLQQSIDKAIPLLNRIYSGKFTDKDLEKAISDLSGKPIEITEFDDYAGHFVAWLITWIKTAGWSLLLLPLMIIPGINIGTSIWIILRSTSEYQRAYGRFTSSIKLIDRGWTPETFRTASNKWRTQYTTMRTFLDRIDDLNSSVRVPIIKGHVQAFCDILSMQFRAETRALASVYSVVHQKTLGFVTQS